MNRSPRSRSGANTSLSRSSFSSSSYCWSGRVASREFSTRRGRRNRYGRCNYDHQVAQSAVPLGCERGGRGTSDHSVPQPSGDLARDTRIQGKAVFGRTLALLLQMAWPRQHDLESAALLADAAPRAAPPRRVQSENAATRKDHRRQAPDLVALG